MTGNKALYSLFIYFTVGFEQWEGKRKRDTRRGKKGKSGIAVPLVNNRGVFLMALPEQRDLPFDTRPLVVKGNPCGVGTRRRKTGSSSARHIPAQGPHRLTRPLQSPARNTHKLLYPLASPFPIFPYLQRAARKDGRIGM